MNIYTRSETENGFVYEFSDLLLREFMKNDQLLFQILCRRTNEGTGAVAYAYCTINLDMGGGSCFAIWDYEGGDMHVDVEEVGAIPSYGTCIWQLTQEWTD